MFKEELEECGSHPEGRTQCCYVYSGRGTRSDMEMIPTFLFLSSTFIWETVAEAVYLLFSLENALSAGEGRLAGRSLPTYQWKQSESSGSSLFVITLVTVNCSVSVTSGNLYTFRFKWKVLFVAEGS